KRVSPYSSAPKDGPVMRTLFLLAAMALGPTRSEARDLAVFASGPAITEDSIRDQLQIMAPDQSLAIRMDKGQALDLLNAMIETQVLDLEAEADGVDKEHEFQTRLATSRAFILADRLVARRLKSALNE